MSWSRLVRVGDLPPAPLSLDAAKAHLRIDSDEEDDDVDALVASAVAAIDGPKGIGIAMVEQTWRLSLDRFCEREIPLLLNPVRSIVSVTYVDAAGDTQTIDAGDYQLDADQDPAILSPTFGTAWPSARCQPGSVKITFKAGFAAAADAETDVPADLVQAIKLTISNLYDNKDGGVPARARDILNRYGVCAPA